MLRERVGTCRNLKDKVRETTPDVRGLRSKMDECSVALNISECDEERRGGVGPGKECATECLWDEEGRAGTEEARGGFSRRDRPSWKKPVFAVTKQKCEGL